MYTVVNTDVLVIGGGAAGCRAAIEARAAGALVLIAVKGGFGRVAGLRGTGASGCAGSPLGFSDIPHVVGGDRVQVKPEDEQDLLYELMIQVGLGMADPRLLKIMISKAPEAKEGLKKWGLVSDDYLPYVHCFITPVPGLNYVVRSMQIPVMENTMIAGLLTRDGQVKGAVAVDEKTGKITVISAKKIILATGGAGNLYRHHFQPSCVTGDGYALAFDAGAEMINIEFHQAIWATAYPTTNIMPGLWGAHPKFINKNGQEFMADYIPDGLSLEEVLQCKLQHWPFSTRDNSRFIDIAAVKEARKGNANEHHAFMIPTDDFKSCWDLLMVPQSQEYLNFRGIDWNQPYIEANISYHCQNGGIKIDENGQSCVNGLYAVGETAAGPFGVDRIAGSMMASGQTFAMLAGRHAASCSRREVQPEITEKEINEALGRKVQKNPNGRKPENLIQELQVSAWDNLFIVKDKKSLEKLNSDINNLENETDSGLDMSGTSDEIKCMELKNLLKVGKIISAAALVRKESRGNFYREDYPNQNDKDYLHSIIVFNNNGIPETRAFKRDENWTSRQGDMDSLSWG